MGSRSVLAPSVQGQGARGGEVQELSITGARPGAGSATLRQPLAPSWSQGAKEVGMGA